MTTIQGKTPAELCEEWEGFSDVDVLKDTEWLRSSMKSLLKGVMEKMPKQSILKVDNGHDCYEANCDYCDAMLRNKTVTDCLAVIQSTIDSI